MSLALNARISKIESDLASLADAFRAYAERLDDAVANLRGELEQLQDAKVEKAYPFQVPDMPRGAFRDAGIKPKNPGGLIGGVTPEEPDEPDGDAAGVTAPAE